jgi:hypothetical protein
MKNFCSMDLVVVLWKSLFLFVTIDLVIVLWIHICIFFCHRLDCRPMEVSFPVDLVIALRRISGLMDLVVVL